MMTSWNFLMCRSVQIDVNENVRVISFNSGLVRLSEAHLPPTLAAALFFSSSVSYLLAKSDILTVRTPMQSNLN